MKPGKDKKKKKDKASKGALSVSNERRVFDYAAAVRGGLKSRSSEITLEDTIRTDPVYERSAQKIENVYANVSIEKDVERLVTLHETRHIRKLSVKEVLSDQQTRLIEAELENGANNTRAGAIKIRFTRASYTIHDAVNKLRKYIRLRYAKELRDKASTVAEREAIVDSLVADYDEYLSELDMGIAVADIVLSDHENAGWSLKRIVDVLQLTNKGGK